jgi:predicted flap endonuclease-1-like 5' DNA nuclease
VHDPPIGRAIGPGLQCTQNSRATLAAADGRGISSAIFLFADARLPVTLALVITAVIVALAVGYFLGRARRDGSAPADRDAERNHPALTLPAPNVAPAPAAESTNIGVTVEVERTDAERARIVRSYEAEGAMLRGALVGRDAQIHQLSAFAGERRRLFDELADARASTARYRQLCIDLEDNAPPPILGAPGAPDDLKLIVGIGPVLERMLHQLGITTYRQIGRWSERDIDDFDARLPEFPGRIRRDGWVAQARALHQSKYGAAVPTRDRP